MKMTCQQFADRLHECLDQRCSFANDRELNDHIHHCDECDRLVQAWRRIEPVLSPRPEILSDSPSRATWHRGQLSLAAIVLLSLTAVAIHQVTRSTSVTQLMQSVDHRDQSVDQSLASLAGIDPIAWWQGVDAQDWVGQTMPAVRSVGEGVAPLGRSLMRAVTILTIGGPDQTS